jgi:UDP-N-acetyl-D-glucosamine dehydrogenase
LQDADCVIICTGHRSVDYGFLVHHAKAVVDTCNATEGVREEKEKVVRLGVG